MGPGVRPEGWLRWFAHPFGGVICRGHVWCPAFALHFSEVAVGVFFFLVFFFNLVYNLPLLHMHAVIFSP